MVFAVSTPPNLKQRKEGQKSIALLNVIYTHATPMRRGRGAGMIVLALLASMVLGTRSQSPDLYVTAGASHACVYHPTTCAYCFGDNAVNQTGTGLDAPVISYPERAPVSWPGQQMAKPVQGPLWPVDALDAGADTTCATSGSSEVMCWGQLHGQTSSPTPVSHGPAYFPVQSMSTSGKITCVIGANSQNMVECTGDFGTRPGASGRVAVGAADIINPNALIFVSVSAGHDHACGRDVSGDVWCVGQNQHGQCVSGSGTNPFIDTNNMVKLNNGFAAALVVASRQFTALLDHAGQLYLYGRDEYGGLWSPSPSWQRESSQARSLAARPSLQRPKSTQGFRRRASTKPLRRLPRR